MTNILSAINLTKVYLQGGKKFSVFENINFNLHAGEVVALFGPSGSGKSSLLNIFGMLDKPTAGEVYINKLLVNDLSSTEQVALRGKNIGFIFQFHHLLPDFSAIENVMLPQLINGIPKKEALERAKDLLSEMGLDKRFHHNPAMLSGGEQQRVAIARAISCNPKLIIADEPTGNLDQKTAYQVFDMLLDMAEEFKVAIIFATHDNSLASKVNRRIKLVDKNLVEF
jgi:lipoprotein-releasing system ATP-binding protein